MSSKPILFYSKKDQRSINLWGKLSKENTLNNFVKICVDNNNKIPSIITTVPSIFIKGRPVISGQAISMFLNNLQPSGISHVSQDKHGVPSNHPSVQPMNNNSQSDTLNDFNPVEMSNRWSDSYSFIQDNPEPMSFSFQFLGNENSQAQNQGNSNQPGPVRQEPQARQRSGDFQNRLEQLQKARTGI
tara:strand:- start:567 stop:1127 length:561 start_codon:yes stop_codon:yes gene_type:complete